MIPGYSLPVQKGPTSRLGLLCVHLFFTTKVSMTIVKKHFLSPQKSDAYHKKMSTCMKYVWPALAGLY